MKRSEKAILSWIENTMEYINSCETRSMSIVQSNGSAVYIDDSFKLESDSGEEWCGHVVFYNRHESHIIKLSAIERIHVVNK